MQLRLALCENANQMLFVSFQSNMGDSKMSKTTDSLEAFVDVNRVCTSFDEMAIMLNGLGYPKITAGYCKQKLKTLYNYFSVKSQSYPYRKYLVMYKGWDEDNRGRKALSDEAINKLFEKYTEPVILDEKIQNELIEAKANATV